MAKRTAIVLVTLAACRAQAAEIAITSDPPLPVANLVVNPDLEEGEDGEPTAWRFTTAMPDNFTVAWRDGGRSCKRLWLAAKSGRMSGYWNQKVRVDPGTKYLFRASYRLEGGRILCYAHARKKRADGHMAVLNERFYAGSLAGHWLVPVFLPPDCLAGPKPDKWYAFELPFTPPEQVTEATLSLGMYFTPGTASFDDVWCGVAETKIHVKVRGGVAESMRRVVVTQTGSATPVYDSKPSKAPRSMFERVIPGQPTTRTYTVTVHLADGRVVTQAYPRAAKGTKP